MRVAVPAASAPSAVATDPASVYQAKTSVRARSGITDDSAACSTERKGPTSFPLGLMTPIVPATRSSQKRLVDAKAIPAAAISSAPGDEHAPAPEPIGPRGEVQRHDRVTGERQRQERADARFAQAGAHQVEDQDDRHRSVREQPDESGGEQQPSVPGQVPEAGRDHQAGSGLRSATWRWCQ